ncbi:hypothetical protein [Leptospira barantonii]|uniref:Uncharacterized protein n=1 Tax=Leptospira barantonii TaxID=2023184 RepID=A0ABX4NPC0_9LEPT|nr:hypothetical protein [Leptospira barantonii]PJZ57462.1 hypothetical protein CH367_08900 [Leptospira barantonii]
MAYTAGIGIRGFLIIDLLRKYGTLNRTDIYSYFTEINDFRRVLIKCLSTLKGLGIIVSDPNKNYSLNKTSYNQVYEDYALNSVKKKNSNPLEKKVEYYQQDFNFHQKKRKAS